MLPICAHSNLARSFLRTSVSQCLGLLIAGLVAICSGCGGGSSGSSPLPPTPTAQISVTVTPASASVILGATQPFSANVTGTTNVAVSWTVNGITGGSLSVGTIDANGVYTAPADLPSPASVTVSATSQAESTASAKSTVTVTSDIAVSVATSPAFTLSTPTSSTTSLTATIVSQGKPDQNVTWSINGVPNGNSAFGTVTAVGSGTATYQAPATVPSPFTITIAATSVADGSKSASIPMIVAGTIARVSQNISAVTGGTLTLPDGSSLTIAPGTLPADQLVELSEVSYLPVQPPNIGIRQVGPGLILTFATPIQFSSAISDTVRRKAYSTKNTTSGATSTSFQFAISMASNNTPLLAGALPTADFIDGVRNGTFAGLDGNYDSTAMIASGSVSSDLLADFFNDSIAEMQFFLTNSSNLAGWITFVPGPLSLGMDNQGNPNWGPYFGCPTGKTALLVHGMASSVQYGEKATFPAATAQSIQQNGNYESVLGFDYDWLQSINTSGGQLAGFLNTLAGCPGVTIDIEAHSEGVPVSMSAIVQNNNGNSPAKINRLIALGGPIMGTPAANDVRELQGLILMTRQAAIVKVADIATILASPFVTDLQVSARGDGKTLDKIRTALAPLVQENAPQMIVVGGDKPQIMDQAFTLVCRQNCDGAIPLTSALAFDSALKVYPLYASGYGHNDLVSNPQNVLPDIRQTIKQQVAEDRTPSLLCTNVLVCEAPRTSSFLFTGNNLSPTLKNITIYSQDSSGAVVQLPSPGLQDAGGSINWPTPACSEQPGTHSIFVFDTTLVSNAVMETVDPATCSTGSVGTITTLVGTGTAGYSGDGGPASGAQLSLSSGIAFDPSGNMFIADAGNNVIRRVDAITQVITTIAGTGVPGYSGDNGPAVGAQLQRPTHVVFDRSGDLYITDALNERVRKVDTNTGIITTVAGNGRAGFSGDGGPATSAELNFPDGVGLDGSGNVYIGDPLNNRIRRLNVTTGIITTAAGTGTTGYSGDGGLATNAELDFPSRPAVDAAGNIYIADSGNNRVRRVDAITGVIVTIAGTGVAGYSGDAGQAGNADLDDPLSVTVDTMGNLYIGDINNERIRVVNTGLSPITVAGLTIQPGTIMTIAGNGTMGYQGDGGPATNAEVNFPTGLLLSPSGNLYFGDANNNVVRVVSLQ
jgi:sugar lactone lactonase YvrE